MKDLEDLGAAILNRFGKEILELGLELELKFPTTKELVPMLTRNGATPVDV